MIVTSDTHFTSNAEDEYRWELFQDLSRLLKRDRDKHLYILGDLTDRRDRHPSDLVNRLVDSFTVLANEGVTITVLCGNHDRPLFSNKPYWSFLSLLPGVEFVRKPLAAGRLLMLPWSADPYKDWGDITMELYTTVFCHQTFDGARMAGNRIFEGKLIVDKLFHPKMRVYSGDVHVPQEMGRLVYIGSPHHIKFGDSYRCRVLALDDKYQITEDVTLHPPSKHTIVVNNAEELKTAVVNRGDAAKIRLVLPMSQMDTWVEQRDAIERWAKQNDVSLAGIEPTIETDQRTRDAMIAETADPFKVLDDYCAAEGIDETMQLAGFELMEQAKGEV